MTDYVYERTVNCAKLHREIFAVFSGLVGVHGQDGATRVEFDRELPDADEVALAALVAQHNPEREPRRVMLGASTLLRQETAVSNREEWQPLAGVVSRPAFFTDKLARVVGQVLGQAFCVGAGAELRLVEDVGGQGQLVHVMSAPLAMTDTQGRWPIVVFMTNRPPSDGANVYTLEARLNGAASLKVRNASLSLIEVIP